MTRPALDLPPAPGSRPPLAELLDAVHVVAIPMRTRFRGIEVREAAVFEGPNGATEFSPFVEYDDAEASRWLAAALAFGWSELPAPRRARIAVNATVPAVYAADVPGVLARFPGCATAKVKVAEPGQSLADDVARVRAVREALNDAHGSDARVRIDANGKWTVDEALTALTALAPFGLDYAEQPCATVTELATVRDQLGGAVRIAADESVRKAEDPLAVARAGAADLLIVKAQPLGGIDAALRIITQAALPVVVSSALETSVGISMGLHLAAALPPELLAGACGLGTVALLGGDATRGSLVPERGGIPVERPILDRDLLTRFRAAPVRERWWHERITRCYAQVEADR